MTDWASIAGGRCQGSPWRVGIAGFSLDKKQAFLLGETDWADLLKQLPLEPLGLYGQGNGLLFERAADAECAGYDALLLIAHAWQNQPFFKPVPLLRQYLLGSAAERVFVECEATFAKMFVLEDLPPFDEKLVWINDFVDFRLQTEQLEQAEADHSQTYAHTVDFWITSLTAAIAADASTVRGAAPVLSVIIPAYNYGHYLRQCVQSVLDQGCADIEILVLDNASTDETSQVMAAFSGEPRVRYMRNRHNYGAGHNWMNGVRIAQGRYFTFLSADDYFNEGHLARLLPVLQSHPQVAVGYTGIRWVDGQGQALNQPRHPGYRSADYVGGRNEVADLLIHDCYMTPSAVIHRREAFRKAWRAVKTSGAGDWDMVVQMAEQHPDFVYIDTPGVSYRWHGAQDSNRFYASTAPLEDHLSIVEGVFQRNAQQHLKDREREVARHIERRLALYPSEQTSPLGARARTLIKRLEALAQFNEAPLFSIVVTTYNRPRLLKDALVSINEQSLRDFDVVVVNDHGESVEHLLGDYDFPITYLRQGYNQGPAAARNAAHHLARGRYLVYLDDDDLFLPEHLQTLASALEEHPGEVVYSDALFIVERIEGEDRQVLGEEQRYPHDLYSHERLLVDNYIPINTFAWPRSLVAEIGGFDERLSGLEDWDFLLRLAARVTFHHVEMETVQVRMRVDNDERRSQQALKDYPALYREIYSRHPELGEEDVLRARAAKLEQMGSPSELVTRAVAADWVAARVLTPVQQRLVQERLQQFEQGPRIAVMLLDRDGSPESVERTLASLEGTNLYRNLEVHLFTLGPAPHAQGRAKVVTLGASDEWVAVLNRTIAEVQADWFVLVEAGVSFTPSGLLIAALDLIGAPASCQAVYADDVMRLEDGETGVILRPDLNLDLLLSFPSGLSRHWLFRHEAWLAQGGFSETVGLSFELEYQLRLIEQLGLACVGHIAEPLLTSAALRLQDNAEDRAVIEQHLRARGYEQATVSSRLPGRYELNYGHQQQPMVSILVLVKERLAQAQRCIETLLENTVYPHYEVLLLDQGNEAPEVLSWLAGVDAMGVEQIRVLRFGGEISQAALCNQAAMQARGDFLLWLDAGAGILERDWLQQLLNHGMRPEVGAVSGKLLSADGKVWHAGLLLGLCSPSGRAFEGLAHDDAGYMQRLQVEQNYSALSGECLMLRRELFLDVGGFAEEPLLARWIDVDLCLKLQQAGYLNVWTPRAQLLLDAPAPTVASPAEEDAMYAQWLPALARDPAYNPGFSLQVAQGFKLADPELVWRPLQAWRPLPSILAHPADLYGCGNYRLIQPLNAMREAALVEGVWSVGLLHTVELERYDPDVLVLQRQIGAERLEAMRRMKAFSRAFKVYELDDYLPNLPLKNFHRQHVPKDVIKTLRRGLGYVDRFVVSTSALAEAFSGLHGDIRVIENRLPTHWWRGLQSQRRTSARPRVGWAGGVGHSGDLEMIADVVKELAGEVDWVFFGMCPEKIRPYVQEVHPGVPIDRYPQLLAGLNLDLALAPVEQNLFNECKSNLRLLEYGACGFPVICSDVRCYQDGLPVTRVKNRFRDWVEAIRMHIADLDAAAKAGDELREAVQAGWMLEGEHLHAWHQAWMPD